MNEYLEALAPATARSDNTEIQIGSTMRHFDECPLTHHLVCCSSSVPESECECESGAIRDNIVCRCNLCVQRDHQIQENRIFSHCRRASIAAPQNLNSSVNECATHADNCCKSRYSEHQSDMLCQSSSISSSCRCRICGVSNTNYFRNSQEHLISDTSSPCPSRAGRDVQFESCQKCTTEQTQIRKHSNYCARRHSPNNSKKMKKMYSSPNVFQCFLTGVLTTCVRVPAKLFTYRTTKCGHWLLLSAVIFIIYLPALTFAQKLVVTNHLSSNKESGICQSVDIRNSQETFEKLRGCRVVEGFVQILLFDKMEESAYANISFPELIEITDYLLLYRVNGLRTLGNLFPNLAVIRGQKTFFNYAFVVFEMSSLQEIGLHSLTDIVHGYVRIDKNPSLCYVNTIDWELIAKESKGEEHFIKSNKLENECPVCPGDDGSDSEFKCRTGTRQRRHLCWNKRHCQKVCPDHCTANGRTCNKEMKECCHEMCLGGCTGSHSDECVACKKLSIINGQKRQCTLKCPDDTYEFLNRRCITKSECINMSRPTDQEHEYGEKPYKAFNGSCLLQCPPNFFEYSAPDKTLTCKPCEGMCQKECAGANIDSVSSAQNLRGCTHIKGSLEIQIRGGRNIVKELEENLNMIEVIEGYLKVARSFPLISLNFLKNLREIRGNFLESQKYVLIVLDNQNLQELWDWDSMTNHTLKIHRGRLFFHFNPKLCLYKIERLQKIARLDDFTDLEVAPNSNGDKVACNVTRLEVNISKIRSEAVILDWTTFKMDDPRSLLGYVVYSIEAPTRNISLYDGRDGCGGDGWRVDDVNNAEDENRVYHILTQLKPYTQYAFYVKTYTIATERLGAQSDIMYFVTLPSVPSIPVKLNVLSTSSSKFIIKWEPPLAPNGNVTYYNVNATCSPIDPNDRDYCREPPTHIAEDKTSVSKIEDTSTQFINETCKCECEGIDSRFISKKHTEKDRVSQINFEDELHNRVYIKRMDNERRKREIDSKNGKSFTHGKNVQTSIGHTTAVTSEKPSENRSKNNCTDQHYSVRGNTTFVMENLPHFTTYTIHVQACREKEVNDSGEVCSSASIFTARTLRAEGVDNVTNVRLNVLSANQSTGMVQLIWDEPEIPNGIILTYQIQYRRVDSPNVIRPFTECVTRREYAEKKEYILRELSPGNYSVSVMATSLAGNGGFSPEYYFLIDEHPSGIGTEITVGVIITILMACIIAIVIFYIRRKLSPSVPNMKLIASVNPEYVSTVYVPDDWEVPRKKIDLLRELGQGSFGMVYQGIARDVVKGKPEIRCAIKTVNEHATDRERIEFLNEASVMKAFDTTHVVRLLGVVSQGQPTLVVMELMANGDLKSYLRSHRPEAETYNSSVNRQPPTLRRILQMAIEIADGMAYLAAKKFVHRDLAARNCMVAEDLTVKIGDFGMTRDIYETDYYRKGTKGLLPVRWMAPESLKDGVFTSNSDVWSYGVVLWEMATLASQPYQGLSNDQVLRYVIDGGIMERPENCPDKLYNLMRVCWQHKPSLRPSFLRLTTMLLDDANDTFRHVSFYHSSAGIDARNAAQAAQDDPSTPLRSPREREIEDFSLGSGSEPDSEPENLVDPGVDSDFDDKQVTIKFPGIYQVASFNRPSLYSFKDNDVSGPSYEPYSDQGRSAAAGGGAEQRLLYNSRRRSQESVQSGGGGSAGASVSASASASTARDSLLKDSTAAEGSGTAGSADGNATANGYVGGGRSMTNNNVTVKTTTC